MDVEVFGRKPDYDPREDSIVRTEAGKLRTRLDEYYSGTGKGDPLVIGLPKGSYVPIFTSRARQTRPYRRPLVVIAGAILLAAAIGVGCGRRTRGELP